MQPRTAILVLGHVINKDVMGLFNKIKAECSKHYDVVFLCDNSAGVFNGLQEVPDFHPFTTKGLQSLNYPGKSVIVYQDSARANNPHHKDFNFIPGSTDLPILLWYKNNPNYDYYWIVEYDVRYSGSWRHFFSTFAGNDSDLLGTTLTRHEHIPGWYHWPSIDLLDLPVSKDAYIRGFFPVYRLSSRALTQLDQDYRRGVKGHYECLVPTVLYHAGMTIEDIGGDGEFVRSGNINRCYRNSPTKNSLAPGTFVFRPVMARAGREPDTLWHPVKYTPAWRRAFQVMETSFSRVKRRIANFLSRYSLTE